MAYIKPSPFDFSESLVYELNLEKERFNSNRIMNISYEFPYNVSENEFMDVYERHSYFQDRNTKDFLLDYMDSDVYKFRYTDNRFSPHENV